MPLLACSVHSLCWPTTCSGVVCWLASSRVVLLAVEQAVLQRIPTDTKLLSINLYHRASPGTHHQSATNGSLLLPHHLGQPPAAGGASFFSLTHKFQPISHILIMHMNALHKFRAGAGSMQPQHPHTGIHLRNQCHQPGCCCCCGCPPCTRKHLLFAAATTTPLFPVRGQQQAITCLPFTKSACIPTTVFCLLGTTDSTDRRCIKSYCTCPRQGQTQIVCSWV